MLSVNLYPSISALVSNSNFLINFVLFLLLPVPASVYYANPHIMQTLGDSVHNNPIAQACLRTTSSAGLIRMPIASPQHRCTRLVFPFFSLRPSALSSTFPCSPHAGHSLSLRQREYLVNHALLLVIDSNAFRKLRRTYRARRLILPSLRKGQ